MQCKLEQAKLDLERQMLDLMRGGKLDAEILHSGGFSGLLGMHSDLKLIPNFYEKDPEPFLLCLFAVFG